MASAAQACRRLNLTWHIGCMMRDWTPTPPLEWFNGLPATYRARALRLLTGRATEAKGNGRHNAANTLMRWASLLSTATAAAEDVRPRLTFAREVAKTAAGARRRAFGAFPPEVIEAAAVAASVHPGKREFVDAMHAVFSEWEKEQRQW